MLVGCYSFCAKMNANKTQLGHFKSLLYFSSSQFYFCTNNKTIVQSNKYREHTENEWRKQWKWEEKKGKNENIIKIMKMLVENGFLFCLKSILSVCFLQSFCIFIASLLMYISWEKKEKKAKQEEKYFLSIPCIWVVHLCAKLKTGSPCFHHFCRCTSSCRSKCTCSLFRI